MGAQVNDETTRRIDKAVRERKSEEREARKEIQKALEKSERREWSQRKFGHERG